MDADVRQTEGIREHLFSVFYESKSNQLIQRRFLEDEFWQIVGLAYYLLEAATKYFYRFFHFQRKIKIPVGQEMTHDDDN